MNNVQTYQTAQFVSNSQQTSQTMTNCSYPNSQPQQSVPGIYQLDGSGKHAHTITMSSANSSTIVNQIKLTNSASTDIITHQQLQQQQQQQIVNTNHQFIQTTSSHQLANSVGYSSAGGQQIVGQPMVSQAIVGQPITIANSAPCSAPFGKAPGQALLPNQNSSTSTSYQFQKLSSLTKESPVSSNSNLIVQNATIVNSTVVNTSTAPLHSSAPAAFLPNSAPILPQPKSSDSFSNLPSPFQEPVTYIDPFTGEVEVEKKRANAGPAVSGSGQVTASASSPAHQPVNSNAKNSNVNITNTTASYPVHADGTKEASNHLSDSDSGISKSTNDASSQSSTERISPSDLIHQTIGQAKLNEPATLLGDPASSLVHFNSDSMIGEAAILKTHNNLVNDMLTGPESFMNHQLDGAKHARKPANELNSINQQVYMLNDSLDKNKSAIHTGAGDQIDDYFNTSDLSDFHLADSSARLLEDEHFAGLPNNQSGALNVNDFLTADFNEPTANKLEFDEQDLAGGHSIAGDHNYTSSGDHTYTTNTLKKRPCASFTGGNSTSSNICSNKIKKVNS